AHDIVSNHMHATTNGSRPPQLRLILRGPGGTGKTAVINAITDAFCDSGMQAKLAKTATSGVAATLISGKTLHTWAGIPIMVPRKDNWLQASPVIAQRRIMHLKDVEYLIIDEISMATKDLLHYNICNRHIRGKQGALCWRILRTISFDITFSSFLIVSLTNPIQ
ncbi:hypothetical protein F5877DRAFT_52600, partial [Lentinula edodes]